MPAFQNNKYYFFIKKYYDIILRWNQLSKKGTCYECLHYRPHLFFQQMGICDAKNELTSASTLAENCPLFSEKSRESLLRALEENGWIFCSTCYKMLTEKDELISHYSERGHALFISPFLDKSTSEESYAAD